MDTQQAALYERIQKFSLDNANSELLFSQRLARDNSWTREYSQRVIEEYKKFAFLAVVAAHPVTPSDQVDQAWHLHLLYTKAITENTQKSNFHANHREYDASSVIEPRVEPSKFLPSKMTISERSWLES